ncbi:MAG: lytic transglycosylase domain-containing protein [Ruminococcus sp.]|nr:lytic transglycosylase domain-containing protein [Ruminococcus sp.]
MSTKRPRKNSGKNKRKKNSKKSRSDNRKVKQYQRAVSQTAVHGSTISSLNDYNDSQQEAQKRRATASARRQRRSKARTHRPVLLKTIFGSFVLLVVISIVIGTVYMVKPDAIKEKVYDIQRLQYPTTYSNYVNAYSEKYDVDPDLVYAVIYTESHFDANAESPAGAFGLMQITSDCFDFLKPQIQEVDKDDYKLKDLFKPGVSIKYGTFFLGYLLDKYEVEETAIAAYNAGFTTVDNWLADSTYSKDGKTLDYIPYEETKNYVEKVESAKNKYKELY